MSYSSSSDSSSESGEDIDLSKMNEIKVTINAKNKSKNGKVFILYWDKNCINLGQGKGEYKAKKWLKLNKKKICKQLRICTHHANWTVRFHVSDKKYDSAASVYSTTRGIIKPGIDKLALKIDDESCDECTIYKYSAQKKGKPTKNNRKRRLDSVAKTQNKRKRRRIDTDSDECDDYGDNTDSDQYDLRKESNRNGKKKNKSKPPKRNARLYGKLIREVTIKFDKEVDSQGIVAIVDRYLELEEDAMFERVPADILVKHGRKRNADRAVNHYNYPTANARVTVPPPTHIPLPTHPLPTHVTTQQQYRPPPLPIPTQPPYTPPPQYRYQGQQLYNYNNSIAHQPPPLNTNNNSQATETTNNAIINSNK